MIRLHRYRADTVLRYFLPHSNKHLGRFHCCTWTVQEFFLAPWCSMLFCCYHIKPLVNRLMLFICILFSRFTVSVVDRINTTWICSTGVRTKYCMLHSQINSSLTPWHQCDWIWRPLEERLAYLFTSLFGTRDWTKGLCPELHAWPFFIFYFESRSH